jgi:hypothetical protein
MLKAKTIILSATIVAAAAVKGGQLVGFDNKPAVENGNVLGVAAFDAEPGDALTVDLIGVTDMIAASAVSAGDALSSNAESQPVKAGEGAVTFARALTSANPGERVVVLFR